VLDFIRAEQRHNDCPSGTLFEGTVITFGVNGYPEVRFKTVNRLPSARGLPEATSILSEAIRSPGSKRKVIIGEELQPNGTKVPRVS
jgi:hypothetical protein